MNLRGRVKTNPTVKKILIAMGGIGLILCLPFLWAFLHFGEKKPIWTQTIRAESYLPLAIISEDGATVAVPNLIDLKNKKSMIQFYDGVSGELTHMNYHSGFGYESALFTFSPLPRLTLSYESSTSKGVGLNRQSFQTFDFEGNTSPQTTQEEKLVINDWSTRHSLVGEFYYSKDGNQNYSLQYDKTVKIVLHNSPRSYIKQIFGLRFAHLIRSRDKSIVIITSHDFQKKKESNIDLFDGKSGKFVRTLHTQEMRITSCALSNNGKLLAWGDLMGGVKIWDIEKSIEISHLQAVFNPFSKNLYFLPGSSAGYLCFYPDNERLLTLFQQGSGYVLRSWSVAGK